MQNGLCIEDLQTESITPKPCIKPPAACLQMNSVLLYADDIVLAAEKEINMLKSLCGS